MRYRVTCNPSDMPYQVKASVVSDENYVSTLVKMYADVFRQEAVDGGFISVDDSPEYSFDSSKYAQWRYSYATNMWEPDYFPWFGETFSSLEVAI